MPAAAGAGAALSDGKAAPATSPAPVLSAPRRVIGPLLLRVMMSLLAAGRQAEPAWYISSSTRYPLNPGLWKTRPFRNETVACEDVTSPGVSWVRSEIGNPRFE